MTKHIFLVLLMVFAGVVNAFAQGLQPRRTFGNRLARPSAVATSNNSATNEAERARIEQRIKNGELPEPLIPIEKALALAEKGEGKGYYQLAVRYAKGEGVEKDGEAAMKFLKKAYDANYPRAIFAVALGTEYRLGRYSSDEVEPSSAKLLGVNFSSAGILCVHGLISDEGSDKVRRLLDMRQALRGRESWEIDNGITNEVFTAWVRSDYEKAKSLGIGAAEKELTRFEKRIELAQAQVKADLEKEAVQKKNDELARRLIDEAAGKTRQFMPFPNSQKLPYQQALEGAEKSDSKSYYWLAYYFAKGEGVDRDGEAALKFLKKAVDANDPVACYTFGLLLEDEALQNEDGRSVGDQETSRGFGGLHFNLRPFGAAAWYTPVSKSGNKCLTNTVAVAHVESLYQKAIGGGFPYATNDIARLHRKIADCKKRIAEKQMEKARREEAANKALSLLDDPTKMSEEDKAARDAEAERELWRSWPTEISDEEQMDIRAQTERKFNCVLMYDDHLSRSSTNSWRSERGVSCILKQNSQYEGDFLQKIDASGKIVGISRSGAIDYVVFEELKWLTDQKNGKIAEHQEKWAKEHGMTLDDAKAKYAKWKDEHPVGRRPLGGLRRPGMLGGGLLDGGSLRARRLQRQQEAAAAAAKQREEQAAKDAERQARAEQEKQQREAERAEQRQQLLAIQEELKRVRGEKAAVEKEGR